jgi:transcriptional regulator with XRE-family HTH domain
MDNPDAIFARRLRELRKEAGATQQQVADRVSSTGIQMHRSTITKIEAGDRAASVGEAYQLAAVLGVTIADLMPSGAGTSRDRDEHTEAQLRLKTLEYEAAERARTLDQAQLMHADAERRVARARDKLAALEAGR